MESPKLKTEEELWRRSTEHSACWKKYPAAGFVANAKDHFDQFANASMAEHRICLKKTIKGLENYIKLKKQNKAVTADKSHVAKGSPAVPTVVSQ